MDFSFLFDVERKLFTIGFNVTASRPDDSYYDLLASEARLASFVGIAKGDLPQQHWFRMGRALTRVNGGRALISWTGTMFEYLMPLLVMRNYRATLLAETYQTVVDRQIKYGLERGAFSFMTKPNTQEGLQNVFTRIREFIAPRVRELLGDGRDELGRHRITPATGARRGSRDRAAWRAPSRRSPRASRARC